MGNMKANKKFVCEDEAVSAVIGVILMVAITVAIAATVYVYVSGMIGTSPETTPAMQLTKDASAVTLTVATADPNDLTWDQLSYEVTSSLTILATSFPSSGTVLAGQIIELSGDGTISIRHVPTNTLIGTWEFV